MGTERKRERVDGYGEEEEEEERKKKKKEKYFQQAVLFIDPYPKEKHRK